MAERAKLALFIAICLMAVGQLLPVHTTFVWLWTAEAVANWLDYLGVDPHLAEMVGRGISAPIMLALVWLAVLWAILYSEKPSRGKSEK